MPATYISRRSGLAPAVSAGKPHAAPIFVDSDTNILGIVPIGSGTTVVDVVDVSSTQTLTAKTLTAPVINTPTTTANNGAVNGSTVTAVERGNGMLHQTVLTLTATPLTLRDTEQGLGVKIYDFPAGGITILGATGTIAGTTTSTLASTLNASVTYNWGVGTTTQASATLATTEQDIIPTTNGTASATINVAGAAALAARTADAVNFNGTSTAIDAFFNVAVASATDIDGDATTTWTGTINITWIFTPDV